MSKKNFHQNFKNADCGRPGVDDTFGRRVLEKAASLLPASESPAQREPIARQTHAILSKFFMLTSKCQQQSKNNLMTDSYITFTNKDIAKTQYKRASKQGVVSQLLDQSNK